MSQIINKPKIFACIPALNEERTLGIVLSETRKFVDEIFVCDDGSTDLTAELSISLGACVIRHKENIGKGAALRTLFKAVEPLNPDIVVTLDGDGQHFPDEIPKIVEPIIDGEADLVIGSRFLKESIVDLPLYRRFGLSVINWLSHSGVRDTQSGFRAFSRRGLEVVARVGSNGYGVETEQISLAKKSKLRILEVPVKMYYGSSFVTSKKSPIAQGAEIIYTMFRLLVEDSPPMTLGVLASIMFGATLVNAYYLILYYASDLYFSTPLALLFFFTLTLGILLGVSALFLHSVQKLSRKINEFINSHDTREKKVEEAV
jgi:glycosyltransferase involved in cell wall biosynthesis